MKLEQVLLRGTRAGQPAANTVPSGTLYFVTDEGVTEQSNAVAWSSYSASAAISPVPLPTNRKSYWWQYNDLFTSYTQGISNPSGVGSLSNVQDAVSTWKRQTTSSSADAYAGLITSAGGAEAPHFNHLPTLYFHIRTGAVITASRQWVGLFDSSGSSTNPGTSATGVLVQKHVAFRYVEGTDTQWVASVADGTTQAVSANIAAIAASTVYVLKIRFITSTSVAFSVNGGPETILAIPTNAADSTDMYQAAYVANKTGGNTRIIDIASLFAEYN